MDARAYAAFFAPDARWKFGNADPVVGQDAIAATAQGVFDMLTGIAHSLREVHATPTGYVALGEVTYSRRDGKTIVLPFAGSYVVQNGKIAFYQTYMDGAPLFAGLGA